MGNQNAFVRNVAQVMSYTVVKAFWWNEMMDKGEGRKPVLDEAIYKK